MFLNTFLKEALWRFYRRRNSTGKQVSLVALGLTSDLAEAHRPESQQDYFSFSSFSRPSMIIKCKQDLILSFDFYLLHMGIKYPLGLSAHLHYLSHHPPSPPGVGALKPPGMYVSPAPGKLCCIHSSWKATTVCRI